MSSQKPTSTLISKRPGKERIDRDTETYELVRKNHDMLQEVLKLTKQMRAYSLIRLVLIVVFLVLPILASVLAIPWLMSSMEEILNSNALMPTESSGGILDIYTGAQ